MEANLKASELRIGNYVKDDEGNIVIVERINSNNIHEFTMVSKNGKIYPSNIYPIQLTEEILLKCGFVVYKENLAGKRYGYEIKGILDSDLSITYWKTTIESGKFYRRDLEIRYLHQLQNLYFALTGEELTIDISQSKTTE